MDFQSFEQTSTLIENAPIGIGLTTFQGKILAANESLLRMTGYSEEEMLHLNVIELYADPGQRANLLEQLSVSEAIKNFGGKLNRKDGSCFFANMNMAKIIRDEGEVILAMIDDVTEQVKLREQLKQEVTERKKVEQELQTQIALIDGLLDAAADTIEIFDPYTMRYLKWNKFVSEISGYSDEEIALMDPVRDFVDEADIPVAHTVLTGRIGR